MNAFVQARRAQMQEIADACRTSLLDRVVPFWTARVVDREHGGYRVCFDSQGRLYDARKPGWFLGRTLYTYSVLCQQYGPRPEWLAVAKAGYDFMGRASVGDGRFAQMLAADSTLLAGAESIFTDHFAVKGLINYLYTLGDQATPQDIDRARALLDRLLEHVRDPQILRTECPDPRFQKHAVNFMTLAVLTESTKLFGSVYHAPLEDCVCRSLYAFASDALQAPLEYITPEGEGAARRPGPPDRPRAHHGIAVVRHGGRPHPPPPGVERPCRTGT